ncbi:putative quinol monooxygenase [Litoreibacter albidus]|uniref:putative quinol monooxygenase n=1 Tax=Litoreibacter albidus TaxID=670155 RepID=UPI003734DBD2
MFVVTVTFRSDPARFDAFAAAMVLNAKTSLALEEGCKQFDVCLDPARPDEVFLYEVYDDEAAFGVHLASDHYATFQASIDGMVTGKDVRTFSQVHQ